jgi:hypothetical protein
MGRSKPLQAAAIKSRGGERCSQTWTEGQDGKVGEASAANRCRSVEIGLGDARLARHRHVAAHHARELAGDGEAKPVKARSLPCVCRVARTLKRGIRRHLEAANCFGASFSCCG